MIIYQIRNKINNKSYFGQSTETFNKRYQGGKWWIWYDQPNKLIRHAHAKYGEKNFEITIWHEDIRTIEELNELEGHYIKSLNTIHPNGYNFKSGGDNKRHHPETIRRIKESGIKTRNRTFKFKNHYTGVIHETNNLTEFCRIHHLSRSYMSNVHLGKALTNKGWTLPDFNLKRWRIKSPNGVIYTILSGDLTSFCREFKLSRGGLTPVLEGALPSIYGWTRPGDEELTNLVFIPKDHFNL